MQATELHKKYLDDFWNRFGGGRKNAGRGFSRIEKLEAIRILSEVKIEYHKQRTIEERRAEFDKIKSTMHKLKIQRNAFCFVCFAPTQARHHLIQLQNGGINCRKNVVSLCDACHGIIHPWLN